MREFAETPGWVLQSALPGIAWPAVPDQAGTITLALLHQLEHSQWLPADRLRELQAGQLDLLLRHARATVPFYRERPGGDRKSVV